ncbi:MAG: NUDIX hydrolase [Saprospirales bacterium]|nr:NUDIX hydrolase [Saprospirales bacterium]MBK7338853.1 NUDIX hydrolase [Saprospirales bacterium]
MNNNSPTARNAAYYTEAAPILVAVDCIILGYDDDRLKLLLFKRKVEPFQNEWSVIGSFVNPSESVDDAAVRVLEEYTGLQNIFMEPLGCYGAVDRDPGARVISQAFFALIRLDEKEVQTVETHHAHWFDLSAVPKLILDHNQMVSDTLEKLYRKARYRPIGFELLPEKFSIPQLQNLYETIYGRTLDRRNFRKKILSMDILDKLDEKNKSSSRKGAFLYRFNQSRYQEMAERGFDFEM